MRSIVTVVAVLAGSLAHAGELSRDGLDCGNILMPPTEMTLSEPDVPYHVIYGDIAAIRDYCRTMWAAPEDTPRGCTIEERAGLWYIYIDNQTQTEIEMACVLFHEKAHLPPNKWEHHPPYSAAVDAAGRWRPVATGPRFRSSAAAGLFFAGRPQIALPDPPWLAPYEP